MSALANPSEPFDFVNVWLASPNAVLFSIVALNSNLLLGVDKPPDAVKNGTFLTA